MVDKLMYIPNDDTQKITPSVDCNLWLKRLYTQLNKATNKNSIKVPKVVKPTHKKTLNTSLIISLMSLHTCLHFRTYLHDIIRHLPGFLGNFDLT